MIATRARRRLEDLLGDRIRFDVPMSRHTSLCVGGPADALATPAGRDELAELLAACASLGIPHRVLGGGFNTLVRDEGLDGVVIRLQHFGRLEARPGAMLRAEAGVSHNRVAKFCVANGFAGLEFGAGIPGTVGGWLAMNAGIPAREVADTVREVEVMSPTGAHLRRIPRASLRFRYRSLTGLAPGSVFLSGLFAVRLDEPESVRKEIERHLLRRAETQPLHAPSCGSVFKNPPGAFAGRLIEEAGLKGSRIGGAEISKIHANFIVNRGGATASDVLGLIERAREAVSRRTGIQLETEVAIVGRTR
ncbi:MAG: UDP-N-acetylmuramate dehydrogenase [Deltaproteobacteria bacterium]|nr:MAG: UDP-N-acetylmuramate dehydrogenase [Deltaproteobacteria bacterium]